MPFSRHIRKKVAQFPSYFHTEISMFNFTMIQFNSTLDSILCSRGFYSSKYCTIFIVFLLHNFQRYASFSTPSWHISSGDKIKLKQYIKNSDSITVFLEKMRYFCQFCWKYCLKFILPVAVFLRWSISRQDELDCTAAGELRSGLSQNRIHHIHAPSSSIAF